MLTFRVSHARKQPKSWSGEGSSDISSIEKILGGVTKGKQKLFFPPFRPTDKTISLENNNNFHNCLCMSLYADDGDVFVTLALHFLKD